jgi:hypothetical protein
MKFLFFVLILGMNLGFASEFKLQNGQAEYTVKHLLKTVKGQSKELKGKMICDKGLCQFLIAIPVKSFISSDSNRDLNMQTILEASKYPLVTVKGELKEGDYKKDQYSLKALVNFHGIEKNYTINIQRKDVSFGNFTILLEDHKIERPSLLTVEIDNNVPIDFSFNWK